MPCLPPATHTSAGPILLLANLRRSCAPHWWIIHHYCALKKSWQEELYSEDNTTQQSQTQTKWIPGLAECYTSVTHVCSSRTDNAIHEEMIPSLEICCTNVLNFHTVVIIATIPGTESNGLWWTCGQFLRIVGSIINEWQYSQSPSAVVRNGPEGGGCTYFNNVLYNPDECEQDSINQTTSTQSHWA